MLKYCIEKGKDQCGRSLTYYVQNAAWLCNHEIQTGKQFFKSSPVYSTFIGTCNKRVFAFAVTCLMNIFGFVQPGRMFKGQMRCRCSVF